MTLGERIKILRNALNLTQAEFGRKLGIARNTIASYEIGRREPMEQTIKSICREYGVEYIWLTQGVGEMFSSGDDAVLDLIDQVMSGESDFAKKVFAGFARFDLKDWQDLQRLVDKLTAEAPTENKKKADP